MLCNNCGSLEHWEKSCLKPKIVSTSKGKAVEGSQTPKVDPGFIDCSVIVCENCDLLRVEINRLRAKYEMTAEEKLARIQEQRREASRRYRNKGK